MPGPIVPRGIPIQPPTVFDGPLEAGLKKLAAILGLTDPQPSDIVADMGGAMGPLGMAALPARKLAERLARSLPVPPWVERQVMPDAVETVTGDVVPRGIRAFHGSPHDFDRFDLSQIGTGEGSQAYGHGLYAAEARPTASSYQPNAYPVVARDTDASQNAMILASRAMRFANGNTDEAMALIRKHRPDAPKSNTLAAVYPQDFDEALRLVEDGTIQWDPSSGMLAEVNIQATPDQLLDLDKPLREQSEHVRAGAIQAMGQNVEPVRLGDGRYSVTAVGPDGPGRVFYGIDEPTPEAAMEAFDRYVGDQVGRDIQTEISAMHDWPGRDPGVASQRLREAGIPGNTYLDGFSRAAGEGTRNYVVFDDALIDIVKKLSVALGAVGGAEAMQDGPREGM